MGSKLKRYDLENCAYFVTTKTMRNKPYFVDHRFAEVFMILLFLDKKSFLKK